jgi:two-component system sensor histidine kinase DesK
MGAKRRDTVFWRGYATLIVLTLLELPFAHEDAMVMLVYVAVLTVASLYNRATPVILALTVIAAFLPPLIKPWHAPVQGSTAVAVVIVSLAMYGFFGILRAKASLEAARAEIARLAAENERSRIARDLHDLLGHSLTTITVKAGLAYRLIDNDPARAAVEIGEVETLTRRSLADVRAAVAGYRDVTLVGELASAREVLRASGIDAQLPASLDVVDESRNELFGWVVREGVTNVVRHSRSTRCTITIGTDWVDILDNGRGATTGAGNGLTGLRERVEAAGGQVTAASAGGGSGWRLRVQAPLTALARSEPTVAPPVRT